MAATACWMLLTAAASPLQERPPQKTEQEQEAAPREIPVQTPKYDYMSTFLSRSTKPLGLKEDLILKNLLGQPATKWAIRAGIRHILE